MSTFKNKSLPFIMWALALSFFAYQFILRLWPGLMMQSIMSQFSINASHFGMLAAFYYYGYSLMQIPIAILLDRYGARYIISIFALLCGVATLIFTYTNNFYIALLSRFLIGAGSAAGFLGVSKVVSQWFSKEQYSKMIGYSFTVGFMGAIYGGKPISLLIEAHEWKNVAFILAMISLAIGISAYFVIRSPKNEINENNAEPFSIHNLKSILASPFIWLLALSNLLMVGSLEGFADVWGVPYLIKAYSIEKCDAAATISLIFFGMLFGGPVLAWLTQKIGCYKVILLCGMGMGFCFILLLLSPEYNAYMLSFLFFIIGMMCCYQVIVFTAGSELVSEKNLGVCVALLNCINMLGGSFFHTLIGKVMDLFWCGSFDETGTRVYSLLTYKYALSFIPLCSFIGALIIFFISVKMPRLNRSQC